MTAEPSPPNPFDQPVDAVGSGVPLRLLLLAGPIIASMASRTAMSFVDFYMVSLLGTDAQAAIMPAQMLLFTIISFGMGTMSVVNAFVAQSLGRNRLSDCSAYAWQGLYMSLAFGALALPAIPYVGAMFAWVGHAPNVQVMEADYVRIGILNLGPSIAAMAMANFFNGVHKPSVGLWISIAANLFNALLNYMLIFGHFGCPAMGIAGASWATTAATFFQTIAFVLWMLLPRYHALYHSRSTWRIALGKVRAILVFGLPAGIQFVIDISCFTVFTLLIVGRFGTVQLAAHNLAFKFLELSFMPTVGLGIAVTSAVGKAVGEGRPHLARVTVRWAVLFGCGYMGTIALAYVFAGRGLVGLLTADPEVASWSVKILLICAVFQVFDALNITHVSALRGTGDTRFPAVMSALLGGVVFIGGAFAVAIYRPQWQSLGPWWMATVYVVLLGVTFWARWAFGPWEKIKMIDHGPIDAVA
ncbi:MAG: MATE family efflux transporter [Phycisphaera sp.]|nr:MATE family efflux transporter [Phycisphaera sp.]